MPLEDGRTPEAWHVQVSRALVTLELVSSRTKEKLLHLKPPTLKEEQHLAGLFGFFRLNPNLLF